jgi:biopolymer transport protein ExbD
MRNLLFGLLVFGTSCSAQQNPNQKIQIDTLKLFDPKPNPNEYGSTEMFKNFVLLNQKPYALTIQGKHLQATSDKELFGKLKTQKNQVVKSKFYVIVDSSFAYSKIIDIIDNLKKLEINDYKIINFDSYFKSPAPIVVQQSTIVTKTIDTNDSTFFNIEIIETKYQVSFLNKKTDFANSKELDSFIDSNNNLIDRNKIFIIGSSNTRYERLKPVIEILKRHDFLKFQMRTK